MKKLLVIMLSVLMALCLAGCNAEKPVEDDKNKMEDTLVVYTAGNQAVLDMLQEEWHKAYPDIELVHVSLASAEAFAKAQAERENPQADVCCALAEIYSDKDLFEPYDAAVDKEIDPALRDPLMLSHPTGGNTSVLIYNTDYVTWEITGYEDLLDPRLKGHIAMGDALKSNSAYYHVENMLLDFSEDPTNPDTILTTQTGWDYVKKFYEQLNGTIISSSSAVYKGVASGEYWVAATYDVGALTLIGDGATNVKCVCMKEGIVTKTGGAGILKNCPHPNAAKAYIEWVGSKEIQQKMVEIPGQISVRTDLDIPAYNDIGYSTAKILECSSIWTGEHKQEVVSKLQTMLEEMNFGA